jgi:hypothetical protein
MVITPDQSMACSDQQREMLLLRFEPIMDWPLPRQSIQRQSRPLVWHNFNILLPEPHGEMHRAASFWHKRSRIGQTMRDEDFQLRSRL